MLSCLDNTMKSFQSQGESLTASSPSPSLDLSCLHQLSRFAKEMLEPESGKACKRGKSLKGRARV